MNNESLKNRLLSANLGLVEDDFGTHYSDLYVVAKSEIVEWLKTNYEFYTNITYFTSQIGSGWNGAGKRCLDIPFAYSEYLHNKK